MRINDVSPPKNAESVLKTPPVESASVVERLRSKSAEESVSETEPHGRSPWVTSEMLSEASVLGSCGRTPAAAWKMGEKKKNSTQKNAAAIDKYMSMTASKRGRPQCFI